MYHVTFARPGGQVYATIYGTPGAAPPADAPALLSGNVEHLRGGFCGGGELTLSAPLPLEPGDEVRVYLGAAPDPLYLGEVTGEGWDTGSGTVRLRSLAESAGRSRWMGRLEKRFRDYLLNVLSLCHLPPGVTAGDIPDDLATLRGSTPHELLSDTLDTAMPVIEGGTWGVNEYGRLGVYRPDPTVTHRFARGQAQTPPGSSDGYANCVRFPYKLPDGSSGMFEGRVDVEADRRGEVWEETQAPASVGAPSTNPLLGLSTTVVTHVLLNGQTVDFQAVKPVFDPAWTGKLADAAPPLRLGSTQAIVRPDQSLVRVSLSVQYGAGDGVTYNMQPVLALTLPGRGYVEGLLPDGSTYNGSVIEQRLVNLSTMQTSEWEALPRAVGGKFNTQVLRNDSADIAYGPRILTAYVTNGGGATLDLRYTAGYVSAWNALDKGPLPGFSIGNAAYIQDAYWPDGATFNSLATVTHTAQLGERDILLSTRMGLYGGSVKNGDFTPYTPANSVTPLVQANVPVVSGVSVLLPAPLNLYGGSAFAVKVQPDTHLTMSANDGERKLTPLDNPPEDTLRFGHGGEMVKLTALRLDGAADRAGGITAEIPDTGILTAYAYGLLRYRVQPVRRWTGSYPTLRRVPAVGVARFETARGEVDLDVQRVVYDLGAGTVTVEAGTPMARTDTQAIVGKVLDLKRETRWAGQREEKNG